MKKKKISNKNKIEALKNWGVEVPDEANSKEINFLYKINKKRNHRIWKDLENWGIVPRGIKSMLEIFKIWNIDYSSPEKNFKIAYDIHEKEKIKRQKNQKSESIKKSQSELTRLKTIEKYKKDLMNWGVQIDGKENYNEIEKKYLYESRKIKLKKWGVEIIESLSFEEIENLYLNQKYKMKLQNWKIKLTGSEDQNQIRELYYKVKINLKKLKYKKNKNPTLSDQHIETYFSENEKESHQTNFEAHNIKDARERISSSIVLRRGQADFRKNLIKIYDSKCAISGTDAEQALEAAHIIPYKGENTNHPSNGILLRSDIHTLFDLGFLSVDTKEMTVIISPFLMNTCYKKYMGKKLWLPENISEKPSKEALDIHRKNLKL
jgi:predicted restriction endonuclease